MDETQIAEKLKQNITSPDPLSPQTPPTPVEEPTDPAGQGTSDLPLENFLLKQELAEYLNIPVAARKNVDVTQRIETILQWAIDNSGSREFPEIIQAISREEGRMGIRQKEDKLDRIYRYIKLSRQMDGIYAQMKALHG